MANTKILTAGDKLAELYAEALLEVLKDLDKRVVDIVAGARTSRTEFDAAIILNSRAQMIEALQASGYNQLSAAYISEYEGIPATVAKAMKDRKLPPPKFTAADAEIFVGLASADLQAFSAIGRNAMDELRIGLYKQAVSNQPFSALVRSVAAATVGVDGKGSPMANHARTIANTAVLDFGGEVLRVAGENIGAEKWEAVGPLDSVTREECQEALSDPVRTEAEWKQHTGADGEPYWGGTPGGFNCRHQLFPVVSE
jgi:hypothetical protein